MIQGADITTLDPEKENTAGQFRTVEVDHDLEVDHTTVITTSTTGRALTGSQGVRNITTGTAQEVGPGHMNVLVTNTAKCLKGNMVEAGRTGGDISSLDNCNVCFTVFGDIKKC